MDFKELIDIAAKNRVKKPEQKPCYQTKFQPPKKESKKEKILSDNIKKFLARKEEEERSKAIEEKKKRDNLLSLRDHKAQSRINKHLKVCKSANKSAIEDAIDNDNTAITLAGPAQCDEDDYGYVSQEASAFYNKLMNKYSSLPSEKPLFSSDDRLSVKDIASTKDRVKQALRQQELEDSLPHRRKKKHQESESNGHNGKDNDDSAIKDDNISEEEKDQTDIPRPKKKPMPPPINFMDLLKIAEKKQYEPVIIEPKPKPKEEPERLMTKKQMKEYAKEKEWRERREIQKLNSNTDNSSVNKSLPKSTTISGVKSSSDVNNKTISSTLPNKSLKNQSNYKAEIANSVNSKSIERTYNSDKLTDRSDAVSRKKSSNFTLQKSSNSKSPYEKNSTLNKPIEKSKLSERNNSMSKMSVSKLSSEKERIMEERRKLEEERRKFEEEKKIAEERRKLEEEKRQFEEEKKKWLMNQNKNNGSHAGTSSQSQKSSTAKSKDPIRQSTSKVMPSKSINQTSAKIQPRQFPPPDVKPRKFPPDDVRPRPIPSSIKSSKAKISGKPNKRRIYDTDEEEYDSELDDFIDDGPQQDEEDYSKYISEIFGYDKNRYRHLDDEDDAAMESNFAQQLREEHVSAKIGYMEDLEDMELEKKEKARMKKKMKR